jgi:SHS2 domain-containing protein
MVEHTGDLALRLSAPDLAGLAVEGVWGLRALLFQGDPAAGSTGCAERALAVRGIDREDALIQALSEALHLLQEEDWVPLAVRASTSRESGEVALELVLTGAPAAELGVRREEEIKAVTYHAVEIRTTPDGLETLVVLDV